jgi:hypothetical protein
MRKLSKKAKFAVAGVTVAAVVGGGTAYAFWSTTGSGSGTAATSAGASSLLVTQTSAISGLAPGVAAQTISGTVKNTATNNAYVNSVTVSIASVTGGDGACSAADYTLSGGTMSVAQDLAPGATANFTGATLAFNNTASNQDGCKNAIVGLAYASN